MADTSATAPQQKPGLFAEPRPDWLALHTEAVIDPERPVVDAHHHLWWRPGRARYLIEEYSADIASGHNVVATVYVDCHSMYRAGGPPQLAPVGEVEFANGVAAMAASGGFGPARMCAAIVGHADLRLGAQVRDVLEAELAAGNGRFRGIRQVTAWDGERGLAGPLADLPRHLMGDERFRAGFAEIEPLGLSFDAMVLHPQLGELLELARAFPETTIIVNHCGGPLGGGRFAANPREAFDDWRRGVLELAGEPNVVMKVGGLATRLLGSQFEDAPQPPTSVAAARAWAPYVETCVEAFGPQRCMAESNFPPDKGQCSYQVAFNALKRIAAQYSDSEQDDLFSATAARVYRLELDGPGATPATAAPH